MTILEVCGLVPAAGLQPIEFAIGAIGAQAGRLPSASPELGPSAPHLPSQLLLPVALSKSDNNNMPC